MRYDKKQIAILGSTGSIGTQALDVIRRNPDLFEVYALTANRNVELLIEQTCEFMPEMVSIADEQKYSCLKEALSHLPVKVWAGEESLSQVVQAEPIQMVLTAMVGYSGLKPTLSAIQAGKPIALANKETLVVAGDLVSRLAMENRVPILPVDSEHSAIFQCLTGESTNSIEKIILTASGGPFRTFSLEKLSHVTSKEALKHPNWNMGAKITIDSATLMNKGLEVIEARHLYGLPLSAIEVLVHKESIIHSLVEYADGSQLAQLGHPDMRVPIAYCLGWPDRLETNVPRLDLTALGTLSFARPDEQAFPCLGLARQAQEVGRGCPVVLNAANEEAVTAFLKRRIGFYGIAAVVAEALEAHAEACEPTSVDEVLALDQATRARVRRLIAGSATV